MSTKTTLNNAEHIANHFNFQTGCFGDRFSSQIFNKILKLSVPVICKQVLICFNFYLKVVNGRKLAKVFPVLKVGELNDPNNYRAISVLPTISRVFEKLVYGQIYHYLNKNN